MKAWIIQLAILPLIQALECAAAGEASSARLSEMQDIFCRV